MSVGTEHRLSGTPDASSLMSEPSRSNSACSGFSADLGAGTGGGASGFSLASVKSEPSHLASYEAEQMMRARKGLHFFLRNL